MVGFAATISCATTVQLQPLVEVPLPIAWLGASEDRIDEAIWRAGRKQSWEIEKIESGRLRGTRRWKRHAAVVSIAHDGRQLRIAYEDSENLRHQGDKIHRSYDMVVERLVASIERESIVPGGVPAELREPE
jgi:hypothetical protein